MLQNCKKFCKSLTKANMINEAAMQLMSLDTSVLVSKYYDGSVVKTKHQLPRDYIITSLLIRQFGEEAIQQHSQIHPTLTHPTWSNRK